MPCSCDRRESAPSSECRTLSFGEELGDQRLQTLPEQVVHDLFGQTPIAADLLVVRDAPETHGRNRRSHFAKQAIVPRHEKFFDQDLLNDLPSALRGFAPGAGVPDPVFLHR